MKGYFSQLAKQSGLQFAKGNIASPGRDARKKAEKITPLHREEIVLASPVLPKKETRETVENIASQKQDPAVRSAAEISASEASNSSSESLKPTAPDESSPTESVSGEKNQREAFFKNKNIETEESNFPASPAVEQIVFSENAPGEISETSKTSDLRAAELYHEAPTHETSRSSELQPPEIIEESAREEESEGREFFSRTAEILESGMPDKLEVQQILLQEINEWVSAVPAPDETENEARLAVLPIEKTAFAPREPAERSPTGADNLQEQNLNLSIGSITVVVEEPENRSNIAAQNQSRAAQKPASEKREFSRLSRYYL